MLPKQIQTVTPICCTDRTETDQVVQIDGERRQGSAVEDDPTAQDQHKSINMTDKCGQFFKCFLRNSFSRIRITAKYRPHSRKFQPAPCQKLIKTIDRTPDKWLILLNYSTDYWHRQRVMRKKKKNRAAHCKNPEKSQERY